MGAVDEDERLLQAPDVHASDLVGKRGHRDWNPGEVFDGCQDVRYWCLCAQPQVGPGTLGFEFFRPLRGRTERPHAHALNAARYSKSSMTLVA